MNGAIRSAVALRSTRICNVNKFGSHSGSIVAKFAWTLAMQTSDLWYRKHISEMVRIADPQGT